MPDLQKVAHALKSWRQMNAGEVPTTFGEFLRVIPSDEVADQFCFAHKLFRVDWFCQKCRQICLLIGDCGMSDGVAWRCPVCGNKAGLRAHSLFERSKLGTMLELRIAFLWAEEWDEETAAREAGVSRATISHHFARLGEACRLWAEVHQMGIGGVGQTVEIDETQLSRKQKDGGRDLPLSDVWIFGGICRESGDIFAERIPNRSRQTLLAYIVKHVRFGSRVISDSWPAYGDLWQLSGGLYSHLKVNHATNFVDPVTGANTQRIERMWKSLKEKKKRMQGIRRDQADQYVGEFLVRYQWRRQGITKFAGTLELIRNTDWTRIPGSSQ